MVANTGKGQVVSCDSRPAAPEIKPLTAPRTNSTRLLKRQPLPHLIVLDLVKVANPHQAGSLWWQESTSQGAIKGHGRCSKARFVRAMHADPLHSLCCRDQQQHGRPTSLPATHPSGSPGTPGNLYSLQLNPGWSGHNCFTQPPLALGTPLLTNNTDNKTFRCYNTFRCYSTFLINIWSFGKFRNPCQYFLPFLYRI